MFGESPIKIAMPKINVPNNCGLAPKVVEVKLIPSLVPDSYNFSDLIEFDPNTVTMKVLKTNDLNLLNEEVSAVLKVKIQEGIELNTKLIVLYSSNGPEFDRKAEPKSITCSPKDKDWSFPIPKILFADQQNAEVTFVQEDNFSDLFTLEKGVIKLVPSIRDLLVRGEFCICDDKVKQLKFDLDSDVLGQNTETFTVAMCTAEISDEDKEAFNLNWDRKNKSSNSNEDVSVDRPTLQISSIDNSGKLTISFDQPMIPVANANERLHALGRHLEKELKSGIEIYVPKNDEQIQSDLDLEWSVIEFTETKLTIQINFANIYAISQSSLKNKVVVRIWDVNFFRSKTSAITIEANT